MTRLWASRLPHMVAPLLCYSALHLFQVSSLFLTIQYFTPTSTISHLATSTCWIHFNSSAIINIGICPRSYTLLLAGCLCQSLWLAERFEGHSDLGHFFILYITHASEEHAICHYTGDHFIYTLYSQLPQQWVALWIWSFHPVMSTRVLPPQDRTSLQVRLIWSCKEYVLLTLDSQGHLD